MHPRNDGNGIFAVIQARMSSNRLPGKVLAPVLGRPLLALQLERVARARIERVVVATSMETSDDAIAALVESEGYGCYRGSLNDVLDRFYRAVAADRPDHVVRLTGDCPLIDPQIIDFVVTTHLKGGFDYTSNTLKRTFPHGEDIEVMRFAALERATREATSAYEREHVTPYLYRHPEIFRLGSAEAENDESHLRWTVDYPEDLELVRAVFEALYPDNRNFSARDAARLFRQRPELSEINAAVNPNAQPATQRR